jgi:hypothetical protein
MWKLWSWEGLNRSQLRAVNRRRSSVRVGWWMQHCEKLVYVFLGLFMLTAAFSLVRPGRAFRSSSNALRVPALLGRKFSSTATTKERNSIELKEDQYVYDPRKIRNFCIIAHIGESSEVG